MLALWRQPIVDFQIVHDAHEKIHIISLKGILISLPEHTTSSAALGIAYNLQLSFQELCLHRFDDTWNKVQNGPNPA